jgi:hypothetical protein
MSIHVELNDLMTRKGYSQTQVAAPLAKAQRLLINTCRVNMPVMFLQLMHWHVALLTAKRKRKITENYRSFCSTVTSAREWSHQICAS